MPIRVLITNDYDHMSSVAADTVKERLIALGREKDEVVLGLATGSSPVGAYRRLAQAANDGEFDSSRIRSFNLDEYVGLPGDNIQQRLMHPESYCYFMIENLFGLLRRKFKETNLPLGLLIDQKVLEKELAMHPGDWTYRGADAGKSVVIKAKPASPYLAWVRGNILDGYARKISRCGGIDLQVIGVGERGHVAFHESGIPFRGSRVMLIRLDDNTIENAVDDGHFPSVEESPRYAVSMGAELVYRAREVVLLASGGRKTRAITESLTGKVRPDVPIAYGQRYAQNGGRLTYVLDRVAGRDVLSMRGPLMKEQGIEVEDWTSP